MGPHGFRASHANFTGDGVAAAPAARRPTAAKISSVSSVRPATVPTRAAARAAGATARPSGAAVRRGGQPLRRRVLLLAASVLRLRPLLPAGAHVPRGHRRLLSLRGVAADDPGLRHLP